MSRATVLVVRDGRRLHVDLESLLRARGYDLVVANSAEVALEMFLSHRPPVTLLDLPLPDASAGTMAKRLRDLDATVTLVVSGTDGDVKSAADAFDLGAYEYLQEITPDAFLTALGSAIRVRRGDVQLRYLRQKDAPPEGWAGLIGNSPALESVVSVLRQICRRTSHGGAPTILLNGETGTGKGFVAKCIHYNSARRNQAFVEINCATLPPSLMEAELFGHERGAFTDAKTARPGLFEAANGGTLFLDEIGAVPLDLQAKLLTAIEEKHVRRIGGRQAVHVDVQIISATHENLEARAREGHFRYDLFHRLNVVAVTMPSLRDRNEDAIVLAESFIAAICREYAMPPRRLSDDARKWITRYAWPGNVRELRNRIERILLLENDNEVRAAHFAPGSTPASGTIRISYPPAGLRVALPTDGVPLEELERAVLREALVQCNGNVSRAARFLSISRQTLIYRMKKHGLVLRPEHEGLQVFESLATGTGTGRNDH